jgi:hypothetical protein
MSEADRDGGRGALGYVLGATVLAGVIGYVIQAVVPGFTAADEYITFSVFWSIVYLVVSALSGVQQEVTRAAHVATPAGGTRTLVGFALLYASGAAVLLVALSPLWAPQVLPPEALADEGGVVVQLVAALAVAAVGYTFVAVLSGALYGVRNWPGVAAMTVSDSVLRLIAIAVALALGAGVAGLGWAVAAPFLLAAAGVWLFTGRGIRTSLALDTGMPGLLRNSVRTVGAAVATGIMISGLPFLLGVTSDRTQPELLASLILVITLTRAPLVIPLLALQSLLIVTFRDAPGRVAARVRLWGAGLLLVTVVGPWVIALLYGDRYALPAPAYAAIVASAGLTALLCLTGPAVLAAGDHGRYLLGWAAASASLIGLLLLPLPELERVLFALCASPVVGVLIHAAGLVRRRGGVSG